MTEKSYHRPTGIPGQLCTTCQKPWFMHRVYHRFEPLQASGEANGIFCRNCMLRESNHKQDTRVNRDRSEYHARPEVQEMRRAYSKEYRKTHPNPTGKKHYIGIDGEGQGRSKHRYVLLAASDESGNRRWMVEAPKGEQLSTVQCLTMILTLPTKRSRVFSYSFNYDLTMMLRDMPDKLIYKLFRPEERQRVEKGSSFLGPHPVHWQNFDLNLQGTKFTVSDGNKRVVIWDLFKFFQAKFVSALKDWKVGNTELWDRMSIMKDKRSEFDKESADAVREYCLEECKCIAELAHKLVDAHVGADLKLKSFYGAGSSGAAMLTAMGIKEKIRPAPPKMKSAVAAAFSGGRFENSMIGEVKGDVYNRDLSSAYPYHITFLPCLLHASWKLVKKREQLEGKRAALVHYGLGIMPRIKTVTWGPFPFRTEDGTISYPIESGGGWVWLDEYLSGERIFPHVEFREAWVYESSCDCQPFRRIPEYYLQRLKIGKEGPGIVIKLGTNSCYGKLAQSVGNALFNSWIWAGMITSGCRAQVLEFLGSHQDWGNMLAVATDGVYTREKIDAAKPRDTGTSESGKPLGGWEEKLYNKGMFFARPGIYFPMNPTKEDIKDIKGRGVGKGVVLENWKMIIDEWRKDGVDAIANVANVTRFCGAKTCITRNSHFQYRRAAWPDGIHPSYGQWIVRQVQMSFNPMPKRECVNKDGVTLKVRRFPRDLESVPYTRAMRSEEAAQLKAAVQEAIEQPDADLSEYSAEDLLIS